MRPSPSGGLPFVPLRTGAAPFTKLDSAAPRRQMVDWASNENLICVESDDNAYTTEWWDACFRVLLWNPPRGDVTRRARIATRRRDFSLLGVTGHLERASAWVHLVGGVGFLTYAALRPAMGLDAASISGRLSVATSILIAVTFGVSVAFHTLGTVSWLAPTMRLFDHASIDICIAVAALTDMSIVTLDLRDVPWQTVADSIGVALVILCFFAYRRIVLPPEATQLTWGSCALGLFRLQHADFEYSPLRSASYVCLSFGFIQLLPAAWANLSYSASSTLVLCNAISLGLLIAGLLIDNLLIWPDVLLQDEAKRLGKKPALLCYSTGCGCVMNSHGWWHVFSLVSVVVMTFGREVAIAATFGRETVFDFGPGT